MGYKIQHNGQTYQVNYQNRDYTIRYDQSTYQVKPIIDLSRFITGATNIGSGSGIYGSTINKQLQLKSLIAGSNISLMPSSTGITISSSGAGVSQSIFNYYSGTTVPSTYLNKSTFSFYSGTTVPNTYHSINAFNAYTGGTPVLYDTYFASPVKSIRTNVDVVGAGQIIMSNGSNIVSGISTTFTDATVGSGFAYWTHFVFTDSSNRFYRVITASITNNTRATISALYNERQIQGGHVQSNATYTGASGTYSYYIARNLSKGSFATAFGNNSYATNFGTAIGGFAVATSSSFAAGYNATATGNQSVAFGRHTISSGQYSYAGGGGDTTGIYATLNTDRRIRSSGLSSFNHSGNNSSQTAGHGALAENSAILGGRNQNVPSNSDRSVVIGGDAIKATSGTTNTVFMPKLRIGLGSSGSLTTNNSNTNVLVRNSSTGEIEINTTISGGGGSGTITGATNGLSLASNGRKTQLGGVLTGNTTIGLSTFALTFTGSSTSIKYGGDYSSTFSSRSLVDKGYVTGITTTKLNSSLFNTFTGTTAPASFASKSYFNTFTGTTAPSTYLAKTAFNTYSGTTVPATYLAKTAFNTYSGTTIPATYIPRTYTGTTYSPKFQTISTTSALVVNTSSYDGVTITGQSSSITISGASHSGIATPDGFMMLIRLKDNGTARTISYNSSNFRAVGVVLPTTTVINKTLYLACCYNKQAGKWDVIGEKQEA